VMLSVLDAPLSLAASRSGADGATPVGTAAVTGGVWSITTSTLAPGTRTFTAVQTDVAGNTSVASPGLSVTIDTIGAILAAPDLDAASDTGTSSTDNITTDTTPTISGIGADAGATIQLFDTGGVTVLGTTTASGVGAWSITTAALAPGTRDLTVRQTDLAGNLSAASPALKLVIDAAGPTYGSALAVNEGFASVALSSTTLNGTDNVTAGPSLRVTAASFVSGTGFVAGDITIGAPSAGAITVTRNAGAVDKSGSITLSTTMEDDAGNATTQNVTITVAAVNDAPVGADNTVTAQVNLSRPFSLANFAITDPNDSPANALQSVIVSTLPTIGKLTLGSVDVVAGQEISATAIAAGSFAYTHTALGTTSFTFQVRDDGGIANGGINLDPTANTMTVNITTGPPSSPKPSPGAGAGGGSEPSAFEAVDPPPIAFSLDGAAALMSAPSLDVTLDFFAPNEVAAISLSLDAGGFLALEFSPAAAALAIADAGLAARIDLSPPRVFDELDRYSSGSLLIP
jgi:large repetitive protein